MAGKKKVINRDSPFTRRLIGLSSKESRSLADLESEFGASRQTISKWLSAEALPDIDQLEKIANYYKVSTDYLLGRCDTMSPNVTLRGAVEYTGLSEAAVERIHNGFVKEKNFGRELPEGAKKEKMLAASSMIVSSEFCDILDNLCILAERSLLERILIWAEKQYWNYEGAESDDCFCFTKEKDRDCIIEAVRDARQKGRLFQEEQIEERLTAMEDEELLKFLEVALSDNKEKMDLQQFLATKNFNRYVDWLLDSSYGQMLRKLGY